MSKWDALCIDEDFPEISVFCSLLYMIHHKSHPFHQCLDWFLCVFEREGNCGIRFACWSDWNVQTVIDQSCLPLTHPGT